MTTTLPPGRPFNLSGLFETRSYVVSVTVTPDRREGSFAHTAHLVLHNLVGYPVTPRGGIMNVTVAVVGFEPRL